MLKNPSSQQQLQKPISPCLCFLLFFKSQKAISLLSFGLLKVSRVRCALETKPQSFRAPLRVGRGRPGFPRSDSPKTTRHASKPPTHSGPATHDHKALDLRKKLQEKNPGKPLFYPKLQGKYWFSWSFFLRAFENRPAF